MARGEVAANTCDGLELAAVRGRRERIASPVEAEALIAVIPAQDRAIWATAMYGGLRRGELQALRTKRIDLATGVIQVEKGWDEREGEIALKSRAGRRKVPITATLRDFLLEHRLQVAKGDDDLAFGRSASAPFDGKAVQERADKAWGAANRRERAAAGEEGREPNLLARITLQRAPPHLRLADDRCWRQRQGPQQTYMGHSSVAVTLDRYGHLMPGTEAEAASLRVAHRRPLVSGQMSRPAV